MWSSWARSIVGYQKTEGFGGKDRVLVLALRSRQDNQCRDLRKKYNMARTIRDIIFAAECWEEVSQH